MGKKSWRVITCLICLCIVISGCNTGTGKKTDVMNKSVTTSDQNDNSKGNNPDTPNTALPNNSSGSTNTDNIQNNKPPEITGVVELPSDGVGKAGVDYKELATGPADDWNKIKIPYFNPLGSMRLYGGGKVVYSEDASLKLEVLDNYYTNTFTVGGERWDMIIQNPDFSVLWLRAYAKKIGAVICDTPGDTAVFHVYENETSQYWVEAELQDKGCVIRAIRCDTVPTGKAMTYKPSEFNKNSVSFYTDCEQGKLQSVTLTLKGGENSGINLSCENIRQYGEYTRLMRKELGSAEEINTKKTDTFVFDDVPICEGQIKWTVSWASLRGTTKPSEVSFQINNIAEIEPIKNGEQLGMLRVAGVPAGGVEILPGDGSDNRHPDFNAGYIIGTRDKDGNTVFSLPSGYYSVRFNSSRIQGPAKGPLMNIDVPGTMRLVPVSAGEITTVTVPREIQLTYGLLQKQYGTFASTGNMEITGNKDLNETATVSIVVNDPLERDIFPEKEDITITENGLKAKVTDIKREPAPVDVVLVLDSSGSMGENMKFAIESAKKFVESLPDNTNIQFVQFEQKITQHKANNKSAVITALGTVKANGGTALYDATSTALKLLEGKEKPYVVLFSDGADSRELKNMGKGSTLTKNQITEKIKASGVTVLSIGFGKGHDPRVLVEMSEASKDGDYFAAMDPNALDQAFAAVSGKFGNQFTITYERPVAVKDRDSDVPVVSFMIDRSGSMDMDPSKSKEDVGYRIDIVKKLFHDFVLKLPTGTLMQLGSFRIPATNPDNIHYDQITTDQKAPVLQGIGQFYADGGTPIVSALTTAYSYLSTVPTSKKTLVYFTDAALAGRDESEKVQIEVILAKMKKDGFRILFAGLGNEKYAQLYNEGFSKAAEISGGEYIITDDIEKIREKLDELMNRIDQPAAANKLMDFTISINSLADDGSRMEYGAQKQVENFAEREKTGEIIKPEIVKISTGEPYATYNRNASMLVYGSDRPNEESTVLEYIPYETSSATPGSFSSKNKEVKLTVVDAYYLNPFKGINLSGFQQQFLALNVDLTLSDDAPIKEYQIPSIFRHFYVSLNNVMTPASQATWLAESPLAEPGDPSVTITDKEKKSGLLVFMVDRKGGQRVYQLSLHFYDTSYGHISIPLVGSIPANTLEINALPKTAPARLSDTFSLSVDGSTDVTELSGVTLRQDNGPDADKNTAFRIIEGQFESNMQALLNIDPTQRFLYAIETDQGALVTKMNDVVYNMPLGFTGSTMLAPGASAPVRMPFQIPAKLAGYSSYLFADLATGGVNLPVTSGTPCKTGGVGKKWSHEYFDMTINALRRVSKDNASMVVLDFTISDKKDGLGLKDISGLLALAKTSSSGGDGKLSQDSAKYFGNNLAVGRNGIGNLNKPTSSNIAPVSTETANLLYGASSDWAVLDGATRRGILLFKLPQGANVDQWALNCGIIEALNQPIEKEFYEYPALLARKEVVKRDTTIENKLREAVTAAISQYQSTRTEANKYTTKGLSQDENVGGQSITPALTIYGTQVLDSIKTDEDFLKAMYAVSCIPNGEVYNNIYSPEAVITQGWGTELDLTRLAMVMLSKLGYQPRILTASLTTVGRENADRITGLDTGSKMPAIAYVDSTGREKAFVIPFMRDISELSGLACISNTNQYDNNFSSRKNRMIISVHAQIIKPKGDGMPQAEAFNSLNAMFGEGGSSSGKANYEDITLFDKEISLADFSMDAADISFAPVGASADGQNEIIAAFVDTKQGVLYNEKLFIDTSFYKIESVTMTVDIGNENVKHTTYLSEGQKLSDVFQTFAFNLPGLTITAADSLGKAVETKSSEGKDAGDYATVKWIGHATVNRFVRGLTAFEEENMPLFGIKAARIEAYPLALVVSMISDGKNANATVDIMHHESKVLNKADKAKKDAFGTVMGIYASIMEAYALGEDKATGFMQVWTQLPQDTPIFAITTNKMNDFAKAFEENGGPPKLVEHLRAQAKSNRKSIFMVPKSPALINGKPLFAWLEMTEDNNGTHLISVSETGEHSAMAEYIVLNAASFGVKPLSAEGAAGFLYGITCIDWGIATYSLKTDNYASIMAQTKVLVMGIQELLATIESSADLTSKLGESGDPQKAIEALEAMYKMALTQNKLHPDLGKIHEIGRNIAAMPTFDEKLATYNKSDFAGSAQGYSFSDGFKAAIDAYFP